MNIINSLIFNIALDFAIITFSFLIIDRTERGKFWRKILQGTLFGFASILTMLFPVVIKEGIIIDTRTIFINLATLIFGRTAGFITTVFTIVYRLYLGGEGIIGGTILSFTAYIISLAFYLQIKRNKKNKLILIYIASLITHIVMVSLMNIFIHGKEASLLAHKLMLPIVVVFPAITTFFAYLITEHQKWKKSFKELEEQKKFSQTILNNVKEMVITINPKNKIIYFNRKTKHFYKKQKLLNENIFQKIKIFNRDDTNITEHLIEEARKNGRVSFANCFLEKGVKKIPVEGTISCIYDNKGNIQSILITILDITDRVEKEKLLTDIMERISDGIESFDKNWNYTFANNQAAKLLNKKSPDELIGKNKWTIEPESVGTPFYEACKEAEKTGRPVFMEHYFKPWNRWFENRIYPSKTGITIFFSDITEKKKLENELKELNNHLNNIFELNPAIIVVWEPDSRKTTFVSKNIEKILGYPIENAYNHLWWRSIVHPEDAEKAFEHSDSVYVEGESIQKFRVFRKDGSTAWILERQTMIKEKNRKKVFTVWLDITFMIETEKKLLEEERKFQKLFNNSAVPMLFIDVETKKIVDSNPAATAMYGYSKEEFKEKTIYHLHSDKSDLKELIKLPDNSYFLETTHTTKEGQKIFVEIYGIPITYQGKEYLFAIIHDITRKKELEKSLIESEARFFLAFHTIPVPFAITTLDTGKIIEVNEAFEKIAKLSKENLIGKSTVELNFWPDKKTRENFVNLLKKQKIIKNYEISFKNAKRETKHGLFSASLIEDKKTKTQYMIAGFMDITELKKLQDELELKVRERTAKYEELNEELKEFTNSLVHDLKEPVRTFKNYSELLLEEKAKEEKQKEYILFIHQFARRLEAMIDELYNYAILENKLSTLGKIPLEKIVLTVQSMLETKIKETNAEIVIPDTLPVVYGNEALLIKIFLNLIDNAIKFRKKETPPKITITADNTNNNFVKIIVKDNGIGIKKEYLKKIFFPFQKAHPDISSEGMGMGLTIVKKSIEIMGGSISVESQENKGSTFIIFLKK